MSAAHLLIFFKDFDKAMGHIHGKENLGLACAGRVSRIGANAEHEFLIGESVLCWTPGSLSNYVQVNARYCIAMPGNLSLNEAVTLPMAYGTMLRGLNEICNLAEGDSILIHNAAEAEGIAAIQISRMNGAEVESHIIYLLASAKYFLDFCHCGHRRSANSSREKVSDSAIPYLIL